MEYHLHIQASSIAWNFHTSSKNACKSLEANFMIDLQHTFENVLELTLSFC
jgi:hypothetical protein